MDIPSLADSALEKLWNRGYDALNPQEQMLVTLWGLEADVNNGVFDQYSFNSYGDQAQMAPAALRRIGANRMARLVEEANAEFGPGGPPIDQDRRQLRLLEIRDAARAHWERLEQEFWQCPEDLSRLLTAYIGNNGSAT